LDNKLLFIDNEVAVGGGEKPPKFFNKIPSQEINTKHNFTAQKIQNFKMVKYTTRVNSGISRNKISYEGYKYVSANENILTQCNNHEAGKHP